MEDMKKGFNQGYELYLKKPSLAESLAKGMKQPYGEYAQGFTSGVIEAIKYKKVDKSLNVSDDLSL